MQVDGDLDEAAARALAGRLRAVAAGRGDALRLDLTDVRYIGSAGVRLLGGLDADLRAAGGTLEVIAPPGTIARRVIDLVRVPITLADEAPLAAARGRRCPRRRPAELSLVHPRAVARNPPRALPVCGRATGVTARRGGPRRPEQGDRGM